MSLEAWGDDDDGTSYLRDHIIEGLYADGWLNEEDANALRAQLAAVTAELNALRKKIEDAPVFRCERDGFNHGSHPTDMEGWRVALVVVD